MSTIRARSRNTASNSPTPVWLVMAVALSVLYAVSFDAGFLSSHTASSSMYGSVLGLW